jgi:predicted MFS family arabinose efflux permease
MSSASPERAVLLLSVGAFVSAASLRATDPMLPLLAQAFGTTPGAAAAVITGFAVAYGLLQVVHGPIGDRIGKYRLVVINCALSALGTLACALAPSLELLVTARFLSGATVGAMIPLSMAWIGDVIPYERRQSVLARFLIGQMLGVSFGATVSGFLSEHYGWRAMFFLLAGLYLLVTLLLWMELRRNPLVRKKGDAAALSIAEGFRGMFGLLSRPWVRVMLITVFLEGMLFYGALAFVALHLHQKMGLGLGASGALVTAFAAGGMLYALVSRRMVQRLGETGIALLGGSAISVGYLALLAAQTPWQAVPCLLAAGAGLYMLHNTLQVNATQMAPESRGAGVSLFALCLFSGQSAGVWVSARIVDGWGTAPLFVVAAVGLPLVALDFRRRLQARARGAAARGA